MIRRRRWEESREILVGSKSLMIHSYEMKSFVHPLAVVYHCQSSVPIPTGSRDLSEGLRPLKIINGGNRRPVADTNSRVETQSCRPGNFWATFLFLPTYSPQSSHSSIVRTSVDCEVPILEPYLSILKIFSIKYVLLSKRPSSQ